MKHRWLMFMAVASLAAPLAGCVTSRPRRPPAPGRPTIGLETRRWATTPVTIAWNPIYGAAYILRWGPLGAAQALLWTPTNSVELQGLRVGSYYTFAVAATNVGLGFFSPTLTWQASPQ